MVFRTKLIKITFITVLIILAQVLLTGVIFASENDIIIPSVEVNFGQGTENVATSIQILALITVLSLAPSILIMMTSFTRFMIVFSFIRRAISLQSTPPNQVLIALALFMTFFVMAPVFSDIMDNAYEPYVNQEITTEEAIDAAVDPLKAYMLRQVHDKDFGLFVSITGDVYEDPEDVPITTIIPAFLLSEIKIGFQIGFLLFIPFIVIDMVVASTLMSLGMMMLPPVMISLPFKVLLFVMVDGWNLLVEMMLRTIR
jgi:flagellar biosynthetic protein FliP